MKKFLPSFLVFSLLLSAVYFPGISPSVQAQGAPVPSCSLFPNTAEVAVTSFVTVLCDQPMDSASVEAALFVTDAGGPVGLQPAMAFDPTIILIPFQSPLQPGEQYTIDLFPTAQSLAGQTLAGPEQVVFSTAGAFAVFMNNHNPPHLDIGVPVDLSFPGGAAMTGIQLDFIAPMSSVSVNIIPPMAGNVVKNPAANDQQWFFQPTGDLANNTPYIVSVSGEDATQQQAARSSFVFRTEVAGGGDNTPPSLVSTNPSDQGKNIPVDADIVFAFDEDIEAASVQAAFIDSSGIAPQLVAHQVSVNGAEVTLTPDSDLDMDTLYDVSIDSAEDLAGNALVNPVSISFTTTDIAGALTVDAGAGGQIDLNDSFQLTATATGGVSPYVVIWDVIDSPANSAVNFDDDTKLDATITPDTVGDYELEVSVTDDNGAGSTERDQVIVTVVQPGAGDVTPPTVLSHTPDVDAVDVSVGANIGIEFSEDVKDLATVVIYPTADPQNEVKHAIVQNASHTLTVDPDDLLDVDTAYTVEVSDVEDLAGNVLATPLEFEFTTTKEMVVFPTMFQHLAYSYSSDLEPGVMPSWLSFAAGEYMGDGDDPQLVPGVYSFAATDLQAQEVLSVVLRVSSPDFLYDAQGNLNIATLMAQIVSGAQADPVNLGFANDVYRQITALLGAAYSLEQINYAP